MQNKRDQLQAYRFVMARLISAMVHGEPDVPETPMRRSKAGVVIGAILAALVLAGFGVYGLVVRGGNTAWREPGTIIVEKETGTRYLLLDGTLRPVLNYASARLAVGTDRAMVRTVSRASLTGVPHGRPIGIPDAPDALPDAGHLLTDDWLVCAPLAQDVSGVKAPTTVVSLRGIQAAAPLGADRAALVRSSDGTLFLLWRDLRLRAPDPGVLMALGFGAVAPLPVDAAWLNAFRAGPDLRAEALEGRGQPGPAIDGRPTRVGQVFAVALPSGGHTHYLVRRDGISPLSPMEATVHLADPGTAAAYQGQPIKAIEVTSTQVAAAPRSAVATQASELPAQPPKAEPGLVQGDQALCAHLSFTGADGSPPELVTIHTGQLETRPTPPGAGAGDTMIADSVNVPPGAGTVIAAQAAPGVPTGTRYLLTDLGLKYPLASDEAASALGFAGVAALPVPTAVLNFIPTGPVLDIGSARIERTWR